MVVQVPASVDVFGLLQKLHLSSTRTSNLKYKIYYLLSQIVSTNENYRLNEKNHGYHNLCSSYVKKVIGNKDFYIIRNILLNTPVPVIQINKSWFNPVGNTTKGGYCLGYRLSSTYNSGEVIYKTLPQSFDKKVKKLLPVNVEDLKMNDRYRFLLDQFTLHKLTFDDRVFDFIRTTGLTLLEKVGDENEYQKILVYNFIGRWLYYINQFEKNEIWYNVSSENHRLNSSLTNLPKILRPYLLCDGKEMYNIDITSSQPYILSSIINNRFYISTTNGFNLKTIYPILYNELVSNGSIDMNVSSSSSLSNEYYTTYSNNVINNYNSNKSSPCSFMWCKFFTTTEINSIIRYIRSPFYLDFYMDVVKRYYNQNDTRPRIDYYTQRDKFKNTMMFVLFEDNINHRRNNQYINIFSSVFPGVSKWIEQTHCLIGSDRFSYLLQRTESYLLLNIICREFNQRFPNIPIYTIHDCIFTHKEHIPALTGFVLKRLDEITGVIAGVKTKSSHIDPKTQIEIINKIWSDIEPVTTEKKFHKISGTVFNSNVERGSDFLKNTGRIF